MAEIAKDIDLLRQALIADKDSLRLAQFNEARNKAMTDDQSRYEILRRFLPQDEEGTIVMPIDTTVAKQFEGWPRREEEIKIPSAQTVLKGLGYEDRKDKKGKVTKSAQEIFVDDYLKRPKYLTEKLSKDKAFGTKSADILKTLFRESVYDIADKETQKRREEVISGTAEDTPWYDWLAAKAMPIFTPREQEAYLRGEDPSLGDYAADIGGNALMMVPAAKYAQVATKIPGVVKAGKFLASKGNAGERAAKVISSVFGNSAAPVATETLQYVGDAIDPNAEAEFNTSRAALGALTNIGVNDVLIPKAAALNKMLLDNQASRQATKEAREALRGAVTGKVPTIDPQAYLVNKLGNSRAADYAATKFGIGKETMDALRQNEKDIDDIRYGKDVREANALNALMESNIEELDKKYIQKIIDNPDELLYSDDTGFKMWLITRGNDLLRGTKYHRPTWEVTY